ncbi:hypothetical protein MCUN1_000744 [Malassezia cuniculi]|uniref:Pentatricopeptide repeat-containing protein n=1 Tax=Malassezia cuniculi TaxID=948313 RepID=A0AAF0ENL4_9BASI|nr:hypothetical protein MCUN1_000744 [Malassezia cuniculi]
MSVRLFAQLAGPRQCLAQGHALPRALYTARALASKADAAASPTHVTSLRAGLAARDISLVWDSWEALQQHNDVSRLRWNDHADILALAKANVEHGAMQSPEWAPRRLVWAKNAAQRLDVAGMHGWMRNELLCGNAHGAIEIFDAYHAARRRASGRVQTSESPSGEYIHLDSNVQHRDRLIQVLELLVLSYAELNDLQALVNMFQSFDVGTHTELLFDYEKCASRFSNETFPCTAPVRARALAWLAHAELARGLLGGSGGSAGRNRIARLLGSTLARRDVASFLRLFRAAMQAGVVGDANTHTWLVQEQLADQHPDALPSWTDSCWSVSLGGLLSAGRSELAAVVWAALAVVQQRICGDGPVTWPPLGVWNVMLDGYSRGGNYAGVEATWDMITRTNPDPLAFPLTVAQHVSQPTARCLPVQPLSHRGPDLLCVTTMIVASFRSRNTRKALSLFEQLEAEQAAGRLTIPIETYNAVLHGLCYVGRDKDAQALLATMGKGKVPPPTVATINALLRMQGRSKNLAAMATTMRFMQPLGLRPDVVTFTTLLDTMLRVSPDPNHAAAAVEHIMQLMDSMDVQPNSITFTSMIKACLTTGSPKHELDEDSGNTPRIDMALQLMRTMATTTKLAPTIVTYTMLISSVLQNSALVGALVAEGRIPSRYTEPLKPLTALGETPEALARDMSLASETAGMHVALVLFDDLLQDRISPTLELYHTLIRALLASPANETAYLRGIALADELLHMNGKLIYAQMFKKLPAHSPLRAVSTPLPSTMSWNLVFRSVLRTHENAADAVESNTTGRLLSALVSHYESSKRYGRAAMHEPGAGRGKKQALENLVQRVANAI